MTREHNTEDPDFSQLETFQSIDVENDWNLVSQRMGFEKARGLNNRGFDNRDLRKRYMVKRGRYLAMAWKVAASLLVILGVGYLSQRYLTSPREMISARAGDELMLVTLQDGSRVSLNSNSELLYPEKFRGKKRAVRLKGEAFFEVEKYPEKPFLVNIEEKAMVEVLGTSFNIRSDPSGEAISVLVVEGRVALSNVDGDAEGKNPGIILEKDEQATITHGIIKRHDAPDKNMLSWKTGILYFDQSYIGDVVNQLEAHYKTKILLDEDVPADLQFTSTIDNQKLESVLEEISMVLGLEITYENGNGKGKGSDKRKGKIIIIKLQ